jgi:hypothetical protein
VAHQQPRPHLAGLGLDAGGQAAVDADCCRRITRPGSSRISVRNAMICSRGPPAMSRPNMSHASTT